MTNNHQYKVYDTTTPLEHFRPNGFYIVGEHAFNYKINALEYATKTNLPVTWEFNTEVYRSLDWRQPPEIKLKDIYRMRAQQLRDKYDYLVLAFSGGADSTTILHTFLENNIKIDEIICEWPNNLIKDSPENSITPDPENYIYEWHLRIQPVLQYLASHHPEIKITKLDGSERMGIEDFEDTCSIVNHCAFISIKRYRAIENYLQHISRTHHNVGLMIGTDKLRTVIDRRVLSIVFTDVNCWWKSSITDYVKTIEYFFWTPDLPEIVKIQAHEIYKYLQQHPEQTWIFDFKTAPNREMYPVEFRIYQRYQVNLIKKIIYPDWDLSIFQADKPESLINNKQYDSLSIDKYGREYQSWRSNIENRFKSLDKKYVNVFQGKYFEFDGYKPFFSRLYPIGVLKNCHDDTDASSLFSMDKLPYI